MTDPVSSNVLSDDFFTGTVDDAIATSLHRRLPLVCFITDGGPEANRWETEYLTQPQVLSLLRDRVVLLRLDSDSVDAALLAEVCPVPEKPHLLIIIAGVVRLKLVSGVSRDDFIGKVISVLPAVAQSAAIEGGERLADETSSETHHSNVSGVRNEKIQDPSYDASLRSTNQGYVEMQRQKRLSEQAEKQRVLRLLENDREERKTRERERERDLVKETIRPNVDTTPNNPSQPKNPHDASDIALSFRLIDGSNIKSRFPSSAMLAVDIRSWVQENRTDGDCPYNFMEILGPSRNRLLDLSDEKLPLSSLFKSSATLVLVPTRTFTTSAYAETTPAGGIVSRTYGMIAGALSAVWNMSFGLYRFGSESATTDRGPPRRGGVRLAAPSSNQDHVQTLNARNRDHDDRRYYNGNQLSFEPNPSDA